MPTQTKTTSKSRKNARSIRCFGISPRLKDFGAECEESFSLGVSISFSKDVGLFFIYEISRSIILLIIFKNRTVHQVFYSSRQQITAPQKKTEFFYTIDFKFISEPGY
jgi:hypothetical protein